MFEKKECLMSYPDLCLTHGNNMMFVSALKPDVRFFFKKNEMNFNQTNGMKDSLK